MKKLNPAELFPKPRQYKKITTENFASMPADVQIISINNKDGSTDKVVPLKRVRVYLNRISGEELGTAENVTYRDIFKDPAGNPVPFEEILNLIEKDGVYSVVRPYSRTTLMTGNFTVPRTSVENWIPESAYEVYVNRSKYKKEPEFLRMQSLLFQKAKEWYDQGQAKIGKWVFREISYMFLGT